MDVIAFAPKKFMKALTKDIHVRQELICHYCHFEWEVVAPMGSAVKHADCPMCKRRNCLKRNGL